ncbi:hypothetical protein [Sandaracinus amylolyticus]|uniref:hypothetical protein n=1 Tax=Sandaracinus amylolyticus TaxID=927083 RepID=UPI001F27C322|nr:hypothetical protein [Sandaracinus amylolyticus]UJR86791.1 Hypothetical protein I5071_88920 [Sandaracinus amylolyticus]
MRGTLYAAIVLVAITLSCAIASAQHTGGSFGGGHFGGGGRSSGGYHGGGYHGGGRVGGHYVPGGYRGGYYHSYSNGGSGVDDGSGALWLVLFVMLGALVVGARPRTMRPLAAPSPQSPEWKNVDLGVVEITVDRATRIEIERAIGTRRTHARAPRRLRRLRAMIEALRARRSDWRLVRVEDHRPMSSPIADGVFRRLADEAQRGVVPDDREVLTIVVASRREIVDVHRSDAEAADRVLRAMAQLELRDIVALEIAWRAGH